MNRIMKCGYDRLILRKDKISVSLEKDRWEIRDGNGRITIRWLRKLVASLEEE
jgi:hypothetical protein